MKQHYLYKLVEAIKELCPESEDRYLTALEGLVRSFDDQNGHALYVVSFSYLRKNGI